MKCGIDLYEYELWFIDIVVIVEVDVIFYNGLNFEIGGNGWFKKLVMVFKKDFDYDVFVVSKGIKVKYLMMNVNELDFYVWLDFVNGI